MSKKAKMTKAGVLRMALCLCHSLRHCGGYFEEILEDECYTESEYEAMLAGLEGLLAMEEELGRD